MKRFTFVACFAAVVAISLAFLDAPSVACTGIRLQSKDGAVIHARTMEFGFPLNSHVTVIPRDYAMSGTTTSGVTGLSWTTKYGAVGMNAFGEAQIIDGVNEKGLAGGIFYMPGLAKYQAVEAIEESRSIAPWELITWALTNYSTVAEVREALDDILVASVVYPGQGIVPPVHYILHDAQGNSLVIEYLDGKLQMHENPIGVITNAPAFDWHLTNLNNYVNLSVVNAAPETIDGVKFQAFGQGSGLVGVPGDFTPPSRFVRAFFLSQGATPGENGPAAVRQAFHVLDSFDIPQGTVRSAHGDDTPYEFTQWTSAADTKNLVYYFHTLNNRRVRRFDLTKAPLDSPVVLSFPLEDQEDVEDLTPPAKDN